MRPELEISVEEKDTFKEVISDSIDIEGRLAANSALRRNKNMDYSKSDESTNNKNNKIYRFNVAFDNKTICLICKKPGQTTEKCFHLIKAQEAVLNNKQKNFLHLNPQRYSNLNGQRRTPPLLVPSPDGSRVGPLVWNVTYYGFLRIDLPAGTSIVGFADDALVVCAADNVGILKLRINDTL